MPRPSGLSRLAALILLALALVVTACASVESGSTQVSGGDDDDADAGAPQYGGRLVYGLEARPPTAGACPRASSPSPASRWPVDLRHPDRAQRRRRVRAVPGRGGDPELRLHRVDDRAAARHHVPRRVAAHRRGGEEQPGRIPGPVPGHVAAVPVRAGQHRRRRRGRPAHRAGHDRPAVVVVPLVPLLERPARHDRPVAARRPRAAPPTSSAPGRSSSSNGRSTTTCRSSATRTTGAPTPTATGSPTSTSSSSAR